MSRTKTATARGRDQLNLVLAADSPLARRLRAAEEATGQSRTRIARDILDAFLDVWLGAEMAKCRMLDAARLATEEQGVETIRLRPRYAGPDRPAPSYVEVVASRRHIAPRVVGAETVVERAETVRYTPRHRRNEPVCSDDELDDAEG